MKARVYLHRDKIHPEPQDDGKYVDRTTCAPAILVLKDDNGSFYLEYTSPVFVVADTILPLVQETTIVDTMVNGGTIQHKPGEYVAAMASATVSAVDDTTFRVMIHDADTPEGAQECYRFMVSGDYLLTRDERRARAFR